MDRRVQSHRLLVAAERASDLTRQLLAYYGRGQLVMSRIKLNRLIIVRTLLIDVLEAWGFRVFTAADGASGVALYSAHASCIGLVLLDLSMPGQSSTETFRQLRAFDPHVRIALSSGYDAADVAARFPEMSISGFRQKPYHLPELIDAVDRYLTAD